MTVYNLSTSLHRFVNERSADLFDGSRPCGFHCEEIAPWVAASYHVIFRTELQVSRALRVGNSIKRKRLKFGVQYVCISWLMIWGDPLNF